MEIDLGFAPGLPPGRAPWKSALRSPSTFPSCEASPKILNQRRGADTACAQIGRTRINMRDALAGSGLAARTSPLGFSSCACRWWDQSRLAFDPPPPAGRPLHSQHMPASDYGEGRGFYGSSNSARAGCWPMFGEINTQRTSRICGSFLWKGDMLAYAGRG